MVSVILYIRSKLVQTCLTQLHRSNHYQLHDQISIRVPGPTKKNQHTTYKIKSLALEMSANTIPKNGHVFTDGSTRNGMTGTFIRSPDRKTSKQACPHSSI